MNKRFAAWVAGSAFLLTLLPVILNYLTPRDSSPEWLYTLKWLNWILFLAPLPCAAILLAATGNLPAIRLRHGLVVATLCLLLACLFCAIPCLMPPARFLDWQAQCLMSASWALGFLLAGISLFLFGARAGSIAASLFCLVGSLFLGLATMEAVLLFSSQTGDGMREMSAESRHAGETDGLPEYANWTNTICGARPGPAGGGLPSFHRRDVFDRTIFDARYTFNAAGWRALPRPQPDAENDLLLFGCSFTFGFGLEDEETWAWQLAKTLGPDWHVENYSANGYSANHMLCLLEHGLIPIPKGRHRFALFLALDQHLRRNEFFSNTPHYHLNANNEAEAGGSQLFNWIYRLPAALNGSQLARDISPFLSNALMKNWHGQLELYLAMLQKSAQILRKKYDTQLIVLIWPGLDQIAPRLEKMGITVILAEPMLPLWDSPDDPGWKYRIDKIYDPHPNVLASRELAVGLSHYFHTLLLSTQTARKVNG